MNEFKPYKINIVEKQVISLRMEQKNLEKIDEVARKTKISRNALIVQCIDYALEHLQKESEKNKS